MSHHPRSADVDLRLHLRTADATTARRAVPVLVWAYTRTRLAQWIYPTGDERVSRLRAVFRQLIDDAVVNGCVTVAYQGSTVVGAVVWRTCPEQDEGRPALPAVSFGDPADTRLAVLAGRLTSCHPPEPHEHLQALAVLPGREGQRIASALLAGATLQPVLPRFLLTAGPLRGLLRQLGYQPYGLRVTLPNGGPPVQPMWCARPHAQPRKITPHDGQVAIHP